MSNYLVAEYAMRQREISKGIAIYDMSQNPPRLVSTHEAYGPSLKKGRKPKLRRTDVAKAKYGVHEVSQGLHVVSRTPSRLGAKLGQTKMYSEPFSGEAGGQIKGYHVDRAKRGLNARRRAIKRGEVRPEVAPAPIRNWMTGH